MIGRRKNIMASDSRKKVFMPIMVRFPADSFQESRKFFRIPTRVSSRVTSLKIKITCAKNHATGSKPEAIGTIIMKKDKRNEMIIKRMPIRI
jgi:hypothetical protein